MKIKRQCDIDVQCEGDTSRREQGFTLVELLIALTIFAIGILAVAAMQTAAMRGGAQSTALTQAVRDITQDKIEELLAMDYGDADLSGSASPGTTHGPTAELVEGVTYSVQWTVIDDQPHEDAKTITVTTTWRDLSGSHTVEATFIKDTIL